MIIVDEIEVDQQVLEARFACDILQCKGACCTLQGGSGAPLLENELDEIARAFPMVEKYLPQEHRDEITRSGFAEKTGNHFSTTCLNRCACVFVCYEDGVAQCSFEKAFLAGELQWRKPVSCHLFPVRVATDSNTRLRFEYIAECSPALERGGRENIPLSLFLRDALTRLYGKEWYHRFLDLSGKV